MGALPAGAVVISDVISTYDCRVAYLLDHEDLRESVVTATEAIGADT
jgi:hypothetical protein